MDVIRSNVLGTDSNDLLGVISQRGNNKPIVTRIEPKMINAPFHIRQGDGSSQHERSCARSMRVLLSTHLYGESRNQDQHKTKTAHFSECLLRPQIISLSFQACRRTSPATAAQAIRTGSGTFQRNSMARLTAQISTVGRS
jgi:hypothetical protein